MKHDTLEDRFVAALLPRLKPEVVEALRFDVNNGRMAFGPDAASDWGPKGQSVKL